MKKIFLILSVLFIGVVIYSGIFNANSILQNDKKVVLTTFTVLSDMAQNVAGDSLTVRSLTKVGAEIHGYEPTPQDLVKAQKADLILDNGLNLERWAQKLYANIPLVAHVTVSDGVAPIPIAEGPYQDKPNPHAWMSPANALVYVQNIRDAFIDLDPANKEIYIRNAENYSNKIRELDIRLRQELAQVEESKKYIVSCEGAFTYLARDYGLKELYLWPINADAQGTPQQVAKVVNQVRANKIPTVFCESTVSDKPQKQVSAETGAQFGGTFFVDSLSGPEGAAPTYLKMMEHNIQVLTTGLKK